MPPAVFSTGRVRASAGGAERKPFDEVPSVTTSSSAKLLTFAGTYRRPPLLTQRMLYATDVSGTLYASALVTGAKAAAVAALEPGVAFNNLALASMLGRGVAYPEAVLAGVSETSVQVVTLATGEVCTLYRPESGRTLAANPIHAASGFGALAATERACAFGERQAAGRIALVLQSFTPGEPAGMPFVLEGDVAIGPTLRAGTVALCTREQIGVYETLSGQTATMALPRHFEPYTSRRLGHLVLSPGTIPLCGMRWSDGLSAVVAGEQGGIAGLLTVHLSDGTSRFEPVSAGSSITSSQDGSLTLAEGEEIRVVGADGWQRQRCEGLRSDMPSSFASPFFFGFRETLVSGQLRLSASTSGQAQMTGFTFTDPGCRSGYCCVPLMSGSDLAVPYFDPGAADDPVLKVARWNCRHGCDNTGT